MWSRLVDKKAKKQDNENDYRSNKLVA